MSSEKLQKFYKSKKWEHFRAIELMKAFNSNGGVVVCSDCGKPIVNKYDAILHHITELTDANVDDAMVSLNPNNVRWVHFKCHNERHGRFSSKTFKDKKVVIVVGAPGLKDKKRYIKEHLTEFDSYFDIDTIKNAISINGNDTVIKPLLFEFRNMFIDKAKCRFGKVNAYYIITSYSTKAQVRHIKQMTNATDVVYVYGTIGQCLKDNNGYISEDLIHKWFDTCDIDELMPP